MKYYRVKPEVAGQLGPNTTYLSTFPTVVGDMEYLFDRWPADEFVRAHPCFAVSNELRALLDSANLTGFRFGICRVGKTDYFEDQEQVIPQFSRLEVSGVVGQDDFGLNKSHHLIVSERVKQILDRRGLSQCTFSEV
jgi:hypothetical protein